MRTYLADLAERTLATYAAALVSLLLAGGFTSLSLSAVQAAAWAALPAAVTVVKGAAGSFIGNSSTAAWLPRGRS
jgi:hypothetical protein